MTKKATPPPSFSQPVSGNEPRSPEPSSRPALTATGFPALLITHSDRDGLFSGAALLRSLREFAAPEVLITQGIYLAAELEELVGSGRRYSAIYITDTYWHPAHAERVVTSLRTLLLPGGRIAWIDHHPSSVENEQRTQRDLPLSAFSRIVGDRDGKHEAVSLVAEAFATASDPVVASLLKAVANGWARNREPMPAMVERWLAVVDGLARCPELPPAQACDIVRCLAQGFECPIPDHLLPLEARTRSIKARTSELFQMSDWMKLPSVDGGWGLLLDLHDEPDVNAYELAVALSRAAQGRIDYFITQEHPGLVHYVSGTGARRERDSLERGGLPNLRVSTLHKGCRWKSATWRAAKGIDLAYLTRRRPAPELLGPWIDAHPYIVKAPWQREVQAESITRAAVQIGEEMLQVLNNFGWTDADRGRRTLLPVVEG